MRFYQRVIIYIIIFGLTLHFLVTLSLSLIKRSRRNQHRGNQTGKWSRNFVEDFEDAARKLDDTKEQEEKLANLVRQAEEANKKRLERAEQVCKKYGIGLYEEEHVPTTRHNSVPKYNAFIIDIADQIAFCPIYNARTSPWLYNLCLLAGMTDKEIRTSKQPLIMLARKMYPELEPEEAEQAFSNTIKIMSVRHPFERLVTAYRTTLENVNLGKELGALYFYNKFGRRIVEKYRGKGNRTKTWNLLKPGQYLWNPDMPKPLGVEPTFQEFVRYLIDTDLVHDADEQWAPYYLFCMTCQLPYNIIGKAETMNLDQMYYLRVLSLEGRIRPSWQHRTRFLSEYAKGDGQRVSNMAGIYFKQLYMREVIKLHEKYKVDFEMFDYDYKDYVQFARDFRRCKDKGCHG